MAPNSAEVFSGPVFFHDAASPSDAELPLPEYRSMWTIQPSFSVLDPARSTPPASSTGLARIGPRIPSGSLIAGDHVRPSSLDVRTSPHHASGLGPTL